MSWLSAKLQRKEPFRTKNMFRGKVWNSKSCCIIAELHFDGLVMIFSSIWAYNKTLSMKEVMTSVFGGWSVNRQAKPWSRLSHVRGRYCSCKYNLCPSCSNCSTSADTIARKISIWWGISDIRGYTIENCIYLFMFLSGCFKNIYEIMGDTN